MIARLLLALAAISALGVLLYLVQSESSAPDTAATDSAVEGRGFVALGAELIETGEDGRPRYRLTARRIEQPSPQGEITLFEPRLVYQPAQGEPWELTAHQGQMPQDAASAELDGNVQAQGRPEGSAALLRFDTEHLHVDMQRRRAQTDREVQVDWNGARVFGRGLRADLISGQVHLDSHVRGGDAHRL